MTALPYGPSVPHMFIVVFLVMLPTYLKTKDPILAWQAGLAWAFIIGCVILIGAFIGPTLRKYTPRAAMLGAFAGISIAFISMRPAFLSWQAPWLAFVSLAIILISWTAGVRLPGGVPGGLAAVLVGTALGWIATLTGISPVMDPHAVVGALAKFGLHLPMPSLDFLHGLADIGPLLVIAVPLGIYNFTEGMNNVESAGAAGDQFDLRKVLLADGFGALAGALLGSPFPPAVYIGHPGWKAVGGRIGYSLATGIVIALVCFLGLTALLLAVVPLVAILPILLYIGLVIGAQAFESTPPRHAPAVILAMLPNIAAWAQNQVDGALAAAGTTAVAVGFDKLAGHGVHLSRARTVRRRRNPDRADARRHRRLHHRPRLRSRGDLRAGRGGAGLFRRDQRHRAGLRQFVGRRARLSAGCADLHQHALLYRAGSVTDRRGNAGARAGRRLSRPQGACDMGEADDLDAFIAAGTRLIGVTIRPEWREAIRLHLAISLDHAARRRRLPAAGRGRSGSGIHRMSDPGFDTAAEIAAAVRGGPPQRAPTSSRRALDAHRAATTGGSTPSPR